MSAAAARMAWLRRASLAAAFLALALQLLFPAGYMAAEPGEARGLPIVICSAQGPMTVEWELPSSGAHKSKAPVKSTFDCAFAGHVLVAGPTLASAIEAPAGYAAPVEPSRPYAVFPGRGLAAPPPPAIGPPLSA